MLSLIVATQSHPIMGTRKERKHFLSKYFPMIGEKYAIVWRFHYITEVEVLQHFVLKTQNHTDWPLFNRMQVQ